MQSLVTIVTVPTYIAFLRAINLGARRRFPKDAIKAATEAAGGTDVETYINTGSGDDTVRIGGDELASSLVDIY